MTMRAWADNNIQCLEYVNHTVKGSKSMCLENKAFHFEERELLGKLLHVNNLKSA
jgi:hypothetical protein